MADSPDRLRVALLAGTLDQGGAEKQLVYLARTLVGAGVELRVYSLTQGEFYERALAKMGLGPIWVGRHANPVLRLAVLASQMRQFGPHVIQSTHSFTNLYAGVIGRLLGAVSIGAMRNSVTHTREANGRWFRWLVRVPDGLFVNSRRAYQELLEMMPDRSGCVCLLPNVIELHDLTAARQPGDGGRSTDHRECRAIFVGRLIPRKRLDRFIRALAIACRRHPGLVGVVVGDGRSRGPMEALAAELGLGPDSVRFLGRRDDVPDLLRQAGMLVLSSDEEGLPNVAMEAMAAGLPVITTPAGDAPMIVEDGVTGYVVPFDDIEAIADRMVLLAESHELRERLGRAGRRKMMEHYSPERLLQQVTSAYREVAERKGNRRLLNALQGVAGAA